MGRASALQGGEVCLAVEVGLGDRASDGEGGQGNDAEPAVAVLARAVSDLLRERHRDDGFGFLDDWLLCCGHFCSFRVEGGSSYYIGCKFCE